LGLKPRELRSLAVLKNAATRDGDLSMGEAGGGGRHWNSVDMKIGAGRGHGEGAFEVGIGGSDVIEGAAAAGVGDGTAGGGDRTAGGEAAFRSALLAPACPGRGAEGKHRLTGRKRFL
jgi:hypothetical protein